MAEIPLPSIRTGGEYITEVVPTLSICLILPWLLTLWVTVKYSHMQKAFGNSIVPLYISFTCHKRQHPDYFTASNFRAQLFLKCTENLNNLDF